MTTARDAIADFIADYYYGEVTRETVLKDADAFLEAMENFPEPTDIAALINSLLAHAQDMGHEARANVLRDAAAALRSLAQELERTKDDLRRVQSVYDFAALTAERDALAQEVERLSCTNDAMEQGIRELEAERDAIRAKTIEECAMATLTTTPKAIRALATEATEAGQESEKLDQKSRPSV